MAAFKRKGYFPNKQTYPTPVDLLEAVQKMYGTIVLDCAADKTNHVCKTWLGPGGLKPDALTVPWIVPKLSDKGLRWLNPPFAKIAPWATKCVLESGRNNLRIAMLVPATVTHNWFWELVRPYAWTRILYPSKIPFKGMANDLPGGFMLCLYGMGNIGHLDRWTWKQVRTQRCLASPII